MTPLPPHLLAELDQVVAAIAEDPRSTRACEMQRRLMRHAVRWDRRHHDSWVSLQLVRILTDARVIHRLERR